MLQVSGPVPAVAELGDSDALLPGQSVLAIGSPLGLSFTNTVTQGIIGALVQTVAAGGPGARAGLQRGDIVLAIGSQVIDPRDPFVEVLFRHQPGETVPFAIQRGSQRLTVPVILGERPSANS